MAGKIDRRDFLKAGAALGIAAVVSPRGIHAQTTPTGVWAYPDTYSVFPGDSLGLHISSSSTSHAIRVRVYRMRDFDPANWSTTGDNAWHGVTPLIDTTTTASSHLQPNNATGSYAATGVEDWLWPVSTTITIGSTWVSDYYMVECTLFTSSTTQPADKCLIGFVVKNPDLKNASTALIDRILYKVNLNTVQAYNMGMTGGSSTYNNSLYDGAIVSPREPADSRFKVTFRRPTTGYAWGVESIGYDYPAIKWLERQGYLVDFINDVDLHLDTTATTARNILARYPVLLSVGHDEYWSEDMFDNALEYRNRGGNIVFLSGNTVCWSVVYDDNDGNGVPTSMRCAKGTNPSIVSGPDAWWLKSMGPEEKLIGAATRHCAIRRVNTTDNATPGKPFGTHSPASPGYRVQTAGHWALAGTSLAAGNVIGIGDWHDGNSNAIVENLVGYEGNGARINDSYDGSADATVAASAGQPSTFTLLGVGLTAPYVWAGARTDPNWWAFNRDPQNPGTSSLSGVYAATMGFHSAYGGVFTGSTVFWTRILNEWDADGGTSRSIPQPQTAPPAGSEGFGTIDNKPLLGNKHLHRITRNVLDALQSRRRTARGFVSLTSSAAPLIFFQTDATRELSFWSLSGTSLSSCGSLLHDATDLIATQQLMAAGRLNNSDALLVFQTDNGALWTCKATAFTNGQSRTAVTRLAADYTPGDRTWTVAAVIDLDADGIPDLLFQNTTTGALWYWLLGIDSNGVLYRRSSAAFQSDYVPGSYVWRLVATPDLNDDGQPDLLFQKSTDGSLWCWTLVTGSGGILARDASTAFAASATTYADRRVVGTAGPLSDQTLVFQSESTGDLTYWKIVSGNIATKGQDGSLSPTSPWFVTGSFTAAAATLP